MMRKEEVTSEERDKAWLKYCSKNPKVLIELEINKVNRLPKKNPKVPLAEFFCTLCNYYCDSVDIFRRHSQDQKHKKKLQDFLLNNTVQLLPKKMPRRLLRKMSLTLERTSIEHCQTEDNLEKRKAFYHSCDLLISKHLPGAHLVLTGSSYHGLGLKDSDINMELTIPSGVTPSILIEVANILEKHNFLVSKHFEDEPNPYLSFRASLVPGDEPFTCHISLFIEAHLKLAILLKKYGELDPRARSLCTLARLWAKACEIENENEGSWPPYSMYLLVIYFLQQNDVLPVLHSLMKEGEENFDPESCLDFQWESTNKASIGELWMQFLRFYSVEFDSVGKVVCIMQKEPRFRKDKGWGGGKKIAVVDPFNTRRNIMRPAMTAFYDYIKHCFMSTYCYFGIPRTAQNGPLFTYIRPEPNISDIENKELAYYVQHQRKITTAIIQTITSLHKAYKDSKPIKEADEIVVSCQRRENFISCSDFDVLGLFQIAQMTSTPPIKNIFDGLVVLQNDIDFLLSQVRPSTVVYSFDLSNPQVFTNGKRYPKCCKVCFKEGHTKNECSEEKLPSPTPLKPLNVATVRALTKACEEVYAKSKQIPEDVKLRETIVEELQNFCCSLYPDTQLSLFGSTYNGFGLKGSDMDLCITFRDNKTGEGLDVQKFIISLYKELLKFEKVTKLVCIPWAKVPIIKFKHKESKVEGDISIYNTLALENTKLLRSYSLIDYRAQKLGFMVKHFAKFCNIGKASKGSLSSYCYTLMVIYFLQRCNPPVLPVLQEMTENGEPPPQKLLGDSNVYFYEDLKKIKDKFPMRNKKSVGELWLQFLQFYTEQFDYVKNVISVRTSKTVTKLDKLWMSCCFAIEDPFDLSHNLGSGLSRRMNLIILRAFRKGRAHFGTPIYDNFSQNVLDFYFDKRVLSDNRAKQERECFLCRKVGHLKIDCPYKGNRFGNVQSPEEDTMYEDADEEDIDSGDGDDD